MVWRERDIFLEYFEDYKTNTDISTKLYGERDRPMPIIFKYKKEWIENGWLDMGKVKRMISISRERNSQQQKFMQKARDYPYRANLNRFYYELNLQLSQETKASLNDIFEDKKYRHNLIRRKGEFSLGEIFKQEIEEDIIYPYIINRLSMKKGLRMKLELAKNHLGQNINLDKKLPGIFTASSMETFVDDPQNLRKIHIGKNEEIIGATEENQVQRCSANVIGEICQKILSKNRCKLLSFQLSTLLSRNINNLDSDIFKNIQANSSQRDQLYRNLCVSIDDLFTILKQISKDVVNIAYYHALYQNKKKQLNEKFHAQKASS